jgi:hypothetical protein
MVVVSPQVQDPSVHVPPKPQLFPHAPQLRMSVLVSVQKNPQRVSPVGHSSKQKPLVQT